MPYLKSGRKKELSVEPKRAQTDGDMNYLFTKAFVDVFTALPTYQTIAAIRKSVHQPDALLAVEQVEARLMAGWTTKLERLVARELAFQEFYRRIAAKYEDQCIVANGDLEEYHRAEEAIQRKFSAEVA